MKKIYIAGCGGMLGEAFYRQFSKDYFLKCTDIDVNDNWLAFCDFRETDSYKKQVFSFKPDYLFHLGAFTDLEYCELHPQETYTTNTESVKTAVSISNELDIPLLYISTAGIFDGKKNLYDENDIPNPIGHYARSKYLGEEYVIQNAKNYLICRAGWMMGGGPNKDKKFINKIIQQIKKGKKELFVVNDKLGTPTYTHDFAKNVKLLIKRKCGGLYNMACYGETSRLEVAKEILKIMLLKNEIKIKEVNSEFFKKDYFAVRPYSERLINKRLLKENLNIMRDWKVCLNEYLTNYYNDYLKYEASRI